MVTVDADKTTTWGDCPNPECAYYGRMQYGITPGDLCEDAHEADNRQSRGRGCWSLLRWWDRWHDGEHRGERGIAVCRLTR